MPDILLSNDDVTVLGPPEIVDVVLDIGPTGVRGSQIFAGPGNPNLPETEIGQIPIENDLYINSAPGTDYAYLYQYINSTGGPYWIQVLAMKPVIYTKIFTTSFTSGNASLVIPISTIYTVTGTAPTSEKFNVQYSIENENPLASSIQVPALISPGDNLVINFSAAEYASSTWSALSGSKKIHVFISIVD